MDIFLPPGPNGVMVHGEEVRAFVTAAAGNHLTEIVSPEKVQSDKDDDAAEDKEEGDVCVGEQVGLNLIETIKSLSVIGDVCCCVENLILIVTLCGRKRRGRTVVLHGYRRPYSYKELCEDSEHKENNVRSGSEARVLLSISCRRDYCHNERTMPIREQCKSRSGWRES